MAVRTAANRARTIAWSRVRDDVGLTNQVCALKAGSGIQKSRRAVRLPFQSTFNIALLALAINCRYNSLPSFVMAMKQETLVLIDTLNSPSHIIGEF